MTQQIFATAADAAFESDLAIDAQYYPRVGPAQNVRVIPAQPVDEIGLAGGGAAAAEIGVFSIRVSEVQGPEEGDVLVVPGARRAVQGQPILNRRRTIWRLDTRPI